MPATTESLWCVVPAAGRGTRFGSERPKQYMPLHGKPLLLRTLERLAACSEIGGLMVVLAADDAEWPGADAIAGKAVRTATGAAERSGSVLAGLRALPESVVADDFVLVHDAARPCVEAGDVARLVRLGVPAGGALLAAPLRDTLKRADVAITDEAMAMERAGHRPLLVEGAESNIKVTTPADLRLAEYLLGAS